LVNITGLQACHAKANSSLVGDALTVSAEDEGWTMYKRILIATDGSELARKAETQGLALAKALNAAVITATVTESWSALDMSAQANRGAVHPIEDYEKSAEAWAKKVLATVGASAKDLGVPCETLHVKDRHPADGIVDTAKTKGCDLIVMASHGRRGLQKVLLGSQANKVLVLSSTPVLICR
jgi:nucleotide-binding universal stress UspA family protein